MIADVGAILNSDTAVKLLWAGIVFIVAAIVGGGLDATGVISFPPLRNWKTQAAVGGFGILIMALSLVSLQHVQYQGVRAAWDERMNKLTGEAVGVPPPQWKPEQVRFELTELVISAGNDYDENCSVAAFVLEFANRLDNIPPQVQAQMLHPEVTPSGGHNCYVELTQAAQLIQTRDSSASEEQHAPPSVGEAVDENPLLAATDMLATVEVLAQAQQSVGQQVAQQSSAARILESLTAVGDQGYIYLGALEGSALGGDRTIAEASAAVGRTVTVRISSNLRAVGTDANYGDHTVYRVLAPGTKVTIETLTHPSERYQWARVRVVALAPA